MVKPQIQEFLVTLACGASYYKQTHSQKDLEMFKGDHSIFITKKEGVTIIAVRGTDELDDWLGTNFKLFHHVYGDNPDALVHAGFLEVFTKFKSIIINGDWGDNIVFCGHSMGGAVASILALEYKLVHPGKNVVLYTAAAPCVGNQGFNNLLVKTIGKRNIYNRRNILDVFNYLPIGWGYRMLPGTTWWFASILQPHHINTYIALAGFEPLVFD